MLATALTSACAMLLATPISGAGDEERWNESRVTAVAAADVNHDGIVDLEDAYAAVDAKEPGTGEMLRSLVEVTLTGYSTGSPIADINGDGMLDFQDWLAFINCFTACLPCADLNGDGACDFVDWLAFLNA